MANIQEKISALCPSATFEEGDRLVVTVEEKEWHSLAKALKEDADLQFDMLTAVVGMDWKDALGVVYYLTSTANWQMIAVKVAVADREKRLCAIALAAAGKDVSGGMRRRAAPPASTLRRLSKTCK